MSEGQATATKSAAPDPLIGRVIADRFRITSLIARGGMGKVYRAEQAPLGRLCALKILNPNYIGDADPEFHRRFFREASIASKITHPNSVTIFDYGKTDDEIYYMAMEYLEGQTLHHALREQRVFPEDRAGRIAVQICRALREAHSLGVIHRDLKPANIFLTRHGDDEDFVKVLDFGLVKHISERPEEQLTQTGLFMGSPKYMAPEQIQGGHVDARTDVYSLGIIMYEMLAGKVPFDRPTSVNILMAHVGEAPPPMREVNPNLVCSPTFEELVMRCIAKDPATRFSSMDDLLLAIKRAHGVSMTGQLAALSASGAYVHSNAPPPVISSHPTQAAYATGPTAPVLASGQFTPMGVMRADSTATPSAMPVEAYPPRRSRAWIGVGVLVAAVMGGGLGMAAFRMTSTSSSGTGATTAPTASAAALTAATASAEAPAASSAAAERVATVHFASDPPGASVHEDTKELCASTPCDVAFKGDDADPKKVHKVTFAKPGFRAEARSMKTSDPQLSAKLSPVSNGARPSRPAVTAKPSSDPTTPAGFKDLPY